MNEKAKNIRQLVEIIQKLPPKMQPVYWIIKNIDIADALAQGEKLTAQDIETMTKTALERDDYLMLLLVLYKQAKDQNSV